MTTRMVDLSTNNEAPNQIDWERMAQQGHIGAVMIKATEGVSYVDPYLESYLKSAQSQKMRVGYYHYAHPGLNSYRTECNHFWQTVKDLPRSLGLALDMEVAESRSWDYLDLWGQEFLNTIPTEVQQRTLYTNRSWLANLKGAPWGHGLWLASPDARPRMKVWAWQQAPQSIQGLGVADLSILYV